MNQMTTFFGLGVHPCPSFSLAVSFFLGVSQYVLFEVFPNVLHCHDSVCGAVLVRILHAQKLSQPQQPPMLMQEKQQACLI
jgi:hypothetical protein